MPFSSSSSSKQLIQQIESFAPREYRKERENFYRQLREDSKSVYKFILQAIVVAQSLYRSELTKKRAKEKKQKKEQETLYWQERDKLEEELQNIASNDLVRRLSWDVDFYELNEVDCPHERRRKRCEEIHGKLITLGGLQNIISPLEKLLRPGEEQTNKFYKGLLKHSQELTEELINQSVDPAKHEPGRFCSPDFSDRSAKMPSTKPSKSKGGRPPKDLQNYLLETVVGCITNAGMSYKEGCGFVGEILICCFDIIPRTHDPRDNLLYMLCDFLERQWLRLHPLSPSRGTTYTTHKKRPYWSA